MERTTTIIRLYAFREPAWANVDLSGFKVEATDGEIGTVDEKTYEIGADALVVDTGPWIFGKKVMLPAGAISRIDETDRRVWVNLSKDEIKNAPEFDESKFRDTTYRDQLGTYYEPYLADTANRPAGPDYGKDDRPAS
jgi:hypothetical protein